MTRCQALVPQLMHPLHPVPYKKPRITLQLSSLRALETVIQECSPRIENWKSTIVEGVAKCWVVLSEGERTDGSKLQVLSFTVQSNLMSLDRIGRTKTCPEGRVCQVVGGRSVRAQGKFSHTPYGSKTIENFCRDISDC
jgi:hypothetical protein